MSWSLHRWVWKLQGPVSVGMPPAGALNRCRLYVPARAVWGALTAEVTQSRSGDFNKEGQQLLERARFSYLFPAEWDGGSWKAWLPRFEVGRGLVWAREDDREAVGSMVNREFRLRLLEARPGTAIAPETDSAADGTLRETECISPYWRNAGGGDGAAVALVGYVFQMADMHLRSVATLSLGGDARYGLGRVDLTSHDEAGDFFGARVRLEPDCPGVETDRVLAHAGTNRPMVGALEHVTGWDRPRASLRLISEQPLWVPGSATGQDTGTIWWLQADGIWRDRSGADAQS